MPDKITVTKVALFTPSDGNETAIINHSNGKQTFVYARSDDTTTSYKPYTSSADRVIYEAPKTYEVGDVVPAHTIIPVAWVGRHIPTGRLYFFYANESSASDRIMLWREEEDG